MYHKQVYLVSIYFSIDGRGFSMVATKFIHLRLNHRLEVKNLGSDFNNFKLGIEKTSNYYTLSIRGLGG